jgi:hypothetical protein
MIRARLLDLDLILPEMGWHDVILSTACMLGVSDEPGAYNVRLECENIPNYSMATSTFVIDCNGVNAVGVQRIQKTHESHRIVEMGAIGVAALHLWKAESHEHCTTHR